MHGGNSVNPTRNRYHSRNALRENMNRSMILKIHKCAPRAAALDYDCKTYAICTLTEEDPTTREEDSWLPSQIQGETNTEPAIPDTSV